MAVDKIFLISKSIGLDAILFNNFSYLLIKKNTTMKNLFVKNASGIKIFSFLLIMFLVFSCSKEESPLPLKITDKSSNDVTLKKTRVYTETVCFEGTSNFGAYTAKEHRLVSDSELNFLLMTAKLTHVDGQNYILDTEESVPLPDGSLMLYRKISFNVKITPGGVIMFSWPETWWELGTVRGDVLGQIFDHTGCIIYGSGINKGALNYKGYFDGNKLYAYTHFMGKQVNPEPEMDLWWNLEGPVKFNFSINLEVINCP